jgi:glycosyltransferase involved in cell wall biosynthesis
VKPQVSVVVATRNRAPRLAALLESLRAQTLPASRFEVIVCDDGSTDDTPLVMTSPEGLNLVPLRHDVSEGPARARNAGVRAARGVLVAFIDDDCVASPRWLQAGIDAWGGDSHRFVQGPVAPITSERYRMGAFSYSIVITGPTPMYECANIFYPRALLEQVGGFDETFPRPAGEDADLGWRVRAAGGVPEFAPEARVEHAVVELGPRGYLRRLWQWSYAMQPYARHPALRETLHHGVFWNLSHYLLLRALLGVGLLRWRWAWPLALWLGRWYAAYEIAESRAHGGTPWLAPWWVARDVVETAACVRGSLRYRVLVL